MRAAGGLMSATAQEFLFLASALLVLQVCPGTEATYRASKQRHACIHTQAAQGGARRGAGCDGHRSGAEDGEAVCGSDAGRGAHMWETASP